MMKIKNILLSRLGLWHWKTGLQNLNTKTWEGRSLSTSSSYMEQETEIEHKPHRQTYYRVSTATQLQAEFAELGPADLKVVISAYNELLPYTWEHHDLYRLTDEALIHLLSYQPRALHYVLTAIRQSLCLDSLNPEKHASKIPIPPPQREEEVNETTDPWQAGPYNQCLRHTVQLNQLFNSRRVWSLKHGQPLVFDCSYDNFMADRETKSFRIQLKESVKMNAKSSQPFNIIMCNRNMNDDVNDETLGYSYTSKCMTDIFPKEDLIMLSPHSPYVMEKFEADKIYIIGGFVDTGVLPLQRTVNSYKRANELGIKSCHLPLSCFMRWGSGSGKALTLNSITHMLLELRDHGDWMKAFKAALPKRVWARSNEISQLLEDTRKSKGEVATQLQARHHSNVRSEMKWGRESCADI